MAKEIVKYDPSNFAVAAFEVDELKQTVEDNLGGDKLSEFDMERYIMPSGKGLTFTVESASTQRSESELVGVIVFQQNRRAWWEKSKDEDGAEDGPPDCQSNDAIHGIGRMADNCGGLCANCPKSKFGSAVDKNGRPAKGQACSQKKCLYIMKQDSILPCVLNVPPTSLIILKQYLAALISARVPYFGVLTRIKLAACKKNGKDYAELRFEMVERITEDNIVQRFKAVGQYFSKSLASGPSNRSTEDAQTIEEAVVEVTMNGGNIKENMRTTSGINPGFDGGQ